MKWEWTDSAPSMEGAFQQSAAYATAARACGGRIDLAVLHDGGQVLATAQVMRRFGVFVVLRGPVWRQPLDAGEQRRALRRLARQGAALMVLPEQAVQGVGILPLMTPRHVALWDLRAPPDELRRQMAGTWRNALGAAERRGAKAAQAPLSKLPDLITAEVAQRQARHYRALPGAFTQSLPTGSLRLWRWRDHAAMCFVRHGAGATYHIGYADSTARAAGAHRVLLWQAALALRAEGVTTLDLGDVNSEDAPGLARFKLGCGARLHRLGSTVLVLPG